MKISICRIYDSDNIQGYRVLVDRIWPRGISKEVANLDDWWKDLTPSTVLRKWFNHEEKNWDIFRENYMAELDKSKDLAREHLNNLHTEHLILLYAAKTPTHNHALILKDYLEKMVSSTKTTDHD